MEIPSDRWYKAVKDRRSQRLYHPQKIDQKKLDKIKSVCNKFKPFNDARAVLITDSPEKVFKGIVGSYGKIKGAPAFIAFVGNMSNPNIQEMIGYIGEGIILEVTSIGLATCWVGGFFRPEVVSSLINIKSGEKVIAVTPFGYPQERPNLEERIMAGFGRHYQRKPLSQLAIGQEINNWPNWIKDSLETARLAPSAVNRQPWLFRVEGESITVLENKKLSISRISKRLDCGIAMIHIEIAALHSKIKVKWEFLQSPEVARFYRV